jgi:hypothetical protein
MKSGFFEENEMTKIEANVPDFLARQARAAAEREQVPLDQIVALALAAQVSAWRTTESIASRAKRADYAAFDRVMAKVPNVPPMPGDELPPGYKRD